MFMKRKVTVIAVNSGGGNDRVSKITADIFENGFRVTFIRLGVNIKAMFMFTVTADLDRFKGGSETLFHFIKKSGTESIAEEAVIIMFDITPKAVIAKAAFGNETVDMRVPFEVSAEGMQDHNEARGEIHRFVLLREHAGDHAGDSMKQAVKEGTVKKKKFPEVFINSKDAVSVSHVDEFKSHRSSALHRIKAATDRTEAAAAADRNKFKLAAMRTAIHGTTKRGIATVERSEEYSEERMGYFLPHADVQSMESAAFSSVLSIISWISSSSTSNSMSSSKVIRYSFAIFFDW